MLYVPSYASIQRPPQRYIVLGCPSDGHRLPSQRHALYNAYPSVYMFAG